MSEKIKHFEELWTDAEKISADRKRSKNNIISNLQIALDDYLKLEGISSTEIKEALQLKKMGEILFMIAELSRTDNVNTYKALLIESQFQSN